MSESSTHAVPVGRTKRIGQRLPGPAVVRVPVKRVGRNTKRLYCERCGQKRSVCRCSR